MQVSVHDPNIRFVCFIRGSRDKAQNESVAMNVFNCLFQGRLYLLRVYEWNQIDPHGCIWFHLYIPKSYRALRVHMEPPQGTLRVPRLHGENH